jgi:hypothetical protein
MSPRKRRDERDNNTVACSGVWAFLLVSEIAARRVVGVRSSSNG